MYKFDGAYIDGLKLTGTGLWRVLYPKGEPVTHEEKSWETHLQDVVHAAFMLVKEGVASSDEIIDSIPYKWYIPADWHLLATKTGVRLAFFDETGYVLPKHMGISQMLGVLWDLTTN